MVIYEGKQVRACATMPYISDSPHDDHRVDVKKEYIMAAEAIIITRHSALVEVLKGLVPELTNAKVIAQATPSEVEGKHVYGVLPLHLAALADRVTTVSLNLPPELRGVELNVEQVRQYMSDLETFKVSKL